MQVSRFEYCRGYSEPPHWHVMEKLATYLASPEYLHGLEQGFWGRPDRNGDIVCIPVHGPDKGIPGRSSIARDMETSQSAAFLFVPTRGKWISRRSTPRTQIWTTMRRLSFWAGSFR